MISPFDRQLSSHFTNKTSGLHLCSALVLSTENFAQIEIETEQALHDWLAAHHGQQASVKPT